MQFNPSHMKSIVTPLGATFSRLSCFMWEFNILFLMQQHIFAHFLIDSNFAGAAFWLSAELRLCLVRLYCIGSVKGADCLQLLSPVCFCCTSLFTYPRKKNYKSLVRINRNFLNPPCCLKIPPHIISIGLNYSGSSLNVNSAYITGVYIRAYQCSICVGWAGGPLAPCYELLGHGAITSTHT